MSAIPAPFFALVGATDAVTAKARALPEKLAEIEIRRFERPSVDVSALDPRKATRPTVDLRQVDLTKVDPRRVDFSKVDFPKVEISEVAGTALELAARAERVYEDFVTRGESVVARVRGREQSQPVAPTPVATPAKAQSTAPKKATKAAAKATTPSTKGSTSTTSGQDD